MSKYALEIRAEPLFPPPISHHLSTIRVKVQPGITCKPMS
jgi:hypothetical protein